MVAYSILSNKYFIKVILTDVHVRVSPDTIELLNRVAVTVAGSGTEKSDNEQESTDYTRLWDFQEYNDNDFWFLRTGK